MLELAERIIMPNSEPGKGFRVSSADLEAPLGTSIGTKLTLTTVGVLLVTSLLLYGELTRRERQSLLAAKATAASMVADLFAASLAAPLDFADQDAIQAELGHLQKNPEVMCAAVFGEQDEKPLATIARGCDASAPMLPSETTTPPTVRADRVEVGRDVTGRSGRVGRTRIVFSLARENAAFAASRMRIMLLSIALAIGTAVLLLAFTRRQIVSPLGRLAQAARRVGRGELGARVDLDRNDEMGQLATTFNQMSEAIKDREVRLSAVSKSLRELFDHMKEGILAFDRDGSVRGEVSKRAKKFFGSDLEGRKVADLFYGDATHEVDAQAFEEFRTLAFEVPLDQWGDLAELAPREVRLVKDGEILPLEVEFRPVVRDWKVERVMILASDVSEKKRLEQAVERQEEEHARRMAAMRRLVAGGANLFVAFTENAREHVASCLAMLGPAPRDLPRPEIDSVFRHVHTMKSEARSFDLTELEKELADLEARLRRLRDTSARDPSVRMDADHAELVSGLQRADDAILRAREDFVAVAPTGRAALDQMTVQRSDVEELRTLVAGGRDERVAKVIERLTARRFGESVATLVDQVPVWAGREGKQVELHIEGRDVRVPSALGKALAGVLSHLVRNAVAHGIETPLDRTREGKEPVGVVKVSAVDDRAGPTIIVEDDGLGLDEPRIRERARGLGLDVDGTPATELVFVAGLSTREAADDLAGLGVGLDAVRTDLRQVGYTVSLDYVPGKKTRFVMRPSAPGA
jgi:two-component system chemotaxis sensor kinase CheA